VAGRSREHWTTVKNWAGQEARRRNNTAAKRIFRPKCLTPLLFLLLALASESSMGSASKGYSKPYITLPAAASASSIPSLHAKAELIAENDSIRPGQDSWLGLRFELESGWAR